MKYNNKIQNIINETIYDKINEAVSLSTETTNIKNAVGILENIYNRIIGKGVSKNEITVKKISKMIQDLKHIQRYWENMRMW